VEGDSLAAMLSIIIFQWLQVVIGGKGEKIFLFNRSCIVISKHYGGKYKATALCLFSF